MGTKKKPRKAPPKVRNVGKVKKDHTGRMFVRDLMRCITRAIDTGQASQLVMQLSSTRELVVDVYTVMEGENNG